MKKIGIFFGTDTGSTRLVAKLIYKRLGTEIADKPLNINRVELQDILTYDALILGAPTYGKGELPGRQTGMVSDCWAEILPCMNSADFSGKTVALYGLGDQDKYGATFANALGLIFANLHRKGANIIGAWPTAGYSFEASESIVDDQFVGLVLDQSNQRLLTEQRIDTWLEQIKPALLQAANNDA